jgi:L-threonylcarbamoyladenylate synthase
VIDEAAAVIAGGGTIIFPTDTVYGIGCDPMRLDAVERIFSLKLRPQTKPLSLHLADVDEAIRHARNDARAASFARRFLPGPLTIIVERPPFIDARVSAGLPSIGLRVPDHAICRALLRRCGPLAATSANFSGHPAFVGDGERESLPEADLLIDAGPTPLRAESTVLDLSSKEIRLIREGALTTDMIEQHIRYLQESQQ